MITGLEFIDKSLSKMAVSCSKIHLCVLQICTRLAALIIRLFVDMHSIGLLNTYVAPPYCHSQYKSVQKCCLFYVTVYAKTPSQRLTTENPTPEVTH